MRLIVALLVLLTAAIGPARGESPAAGKVESCNFATKSLPPAFRVPKQFAEGYKLFKAGGTLLTEKVVMETVVQAGGGQLNLTPKEIERLSASLDKVYDSISADPLFANVPSALPYCLADSRPSQGHYFAYYPAGAKDDTPVIVFLHGFGGNFLFFSYVLKEEFPQSIILVPSWSASWEDGTMQYLEDMFKDVKRRHSLAIRKLALMAISAGGPAGFRIYNDHRERFSSFVSIVSAPPAAIVPKLHDDLKILMLNGKQDTRFRLASVKPLADKIAARLPGFQFQAVDGDHFLLLEKREETFRAIRAFLQQ